MPDFRETYMSDAVATASGEQVLVMLCDRMVLDIQRGLEAQMSGDASEAHSQLMHAQDVIAHLNATLRRDVWDGAERMAGVYEWLASHLAQANLRKDPKITGEALRVANDVAEMWREAVALAAAEAVVTS